MINDVSGFTDPGLLPVLLESSCQYVLMHSLSVPADRARTLPEDTDPVAAVKEWAVRRIELLQNSGLDPARVIFDPGIGFGKTAEQSLTLLRRMEEFLDLPVRLLIGHSRKSFMEAWGSRPASERDPESVGASLALAARGADILRVHAPHIHARAWRAHQEVQA
jgi:dihydropteroate synthase